MVVAWYFMNKENQNDPCRFNKSFIHYVKVKTEREEFFLSFKRRLIVRLIVKFRLPLKGKKKSKPIIISILLYLVSIFMTCSYIK